MTYNVSNTIENVRSHPAASRILPITEKQKKANEVAERRSIMARSAALNETNDSNSTSNETTIVLGENCDETNIEVSIRPWQDFDALVIGSPGTCLCPTRRLGTSCPAKARLLDVSGWFSQKRFNGSFSASSI